MSVDPACAVPEIVGSAVFTGGTGGGGAGGGGEGAGAGAEGAVTAGRSAISWPTLLLFFT